MMSIHKQLIEGFDFLKLQKYDQALIAAQTILTKKFNLDALMLAGISAYNLRNYELAEIFFEKLYAEKPQQVTVIYYLETFS